MRKPYRIVVWGPGALGCATLRELLRRPEFEVVAVVGYSDNKIGRDAGELIGRAPIGVKITPYADKEAIFAMDADCVLWTGVFPFPGVQEQMDIDVIRLLESGKHVVAATNYFYLHGHDADYLERFEDACKKGKSCLLGTGENPGFWFEREILNLTGMCNKVEFIELRENCDCEESGTTTEFLTNFGFSLPPGKTAAMKILDTIWDKRYYIESMNVVSMALWGKPLDNFEHETKEHLAEKEFVFDKRLGHGINMIVPQGHTKAKEAHYRGYVDGQLRISLRGYWWLGQSNPFLGKRDSTWEIDIKGLPNSLKCTFEVESTRADPSDKATATWYITAMMIIQGVPRVCSHSPGIVYPTVFAYAAPDYRLLETRQSVVG